MYHRRRAQLRVRDILRQLSAWNGLRFLVECSRLAATGVSNQLTSTVSRETKEENRV
jgi:hypothetical protein